MRDFYRPKTKYYLLDWFKSNRPLWRVSRWNKKQLYAVYVKEMGKYTLCSAKTQDESCIG